MQEQLDLKQPQAPRLSHTKKNLEELPPIPDKRYFTIGEASDLCLVKPHVLRYWEKEFDQLNPNKRRGQRRYYQHDDIILVRRIRSLLYEQGFTIEGAKLKLSTHDGKQAESNQFVKALSDTISQLKQILSNLEHK